MANPNAQTFSDCYLVLDDVEEITNLLLQEYDWIRVHRDMDQTRSVNPLRFSAETAEWDMERWAESRRYVRMEHYLQEGDLAPDGFRIVAGKSGVAPTISIIQSKGSIEVEYDRFDQFDHTSFLMGERIAALLLNHRLQPRYLTSRFLWIVLGFTAFQLGFTNSLIVALLCLAVSLGLHIYRTEIPRIHLLPREQALRGRWRHVRRAVSGGLLFAVVAVVLVVFFP